MTDNLKKDSWLNLVLWLANVRFNLIIEVIEILWSLALFLFRSFWIKTYNREKLVPYAEQGSLTLPEYLGSPIVFDGSCLVLIFLCCVFCIVVCLLVFFFTMSSVLFLRVSLTVSFASYSLNHILFFLVL